MKVCVLGDVMLDVYRTITPMKLSQEAPVVVGRFEHDQFVPGGAANAAANCVALGAEAVLVGFIGLDNTGKCLVPVLKSFGVTVDCVTPANWDTIRKERIVDSTGHQFLRIDSEVPDPLIKKASVAALRKKLRAAVETCDCLFVSDYAKGTCQWIIEYATRLFKRNGKFVVVNGKPANFSKYCYGVNVLTMNETEWRECNQLLVNPARIDYPEQLLHRMRLVFPDTTLVMTRGPEPLLVLRPKDHVVSSYHPVKLVDVADVSGAGDTLAAVIAVYGDDNGDTMCEAMCAAAEVVQFRGTAVPQRRRI